MKTLEIILVAFSILIWIPIYATRKKGDLMAKWVGGFVIYVWIPIVIIKFLFN